jgi:hypothetical protein
MRQSSIPLHGTRSPRARLLAAVGLASGVLIAGCGGGGSSPGVANATSSRTSASSAAAHGTTTSSRSSSATTSSKNDAGRLLVEWASCMRRHGDPDQADPSITSGDVIDIPWNPAIPGGYNGTNKGGQGNSGPGQYCRTDLNAAQTALQGGRQPKPPNPAALVRYSECMRANGVPDFPDPGANGNLVLQGGPSTVNNPIFRRAAKVCTSKTGVSLPGQQGPPPGTITLSGS